MGINITGMPTGVALTGDIPAPSPNDSTIVTSGRMLCQANGTYDLTVGAGKIWYIVGWNITGSNSNNTTVEIQFNAVPFASVWFEGSSTYKPTQITNYSFHYPACPKLTAGQKVEAYKGGDTSKTMVVDIHYIEVDA